MLATSFIAFFAGAVVSLGASWVLVSRLERVGKRLGFSEAMLGLVAALTADAPEITASVTALLHHQQSVGAGVVLGSNVFNLAALLGLGAVVAGRVVLHRRVVVLSGVIAALVAILCLLSVTGAVSPLVALAPVLVVLAVYFTTLSSPSGVLRRIPLPAPWKDWIATAITEEEAELGIAIHPRSGSSRDAVVGAISMAVVVFASVAMERGASTLGARYGVADAVIGGLVLAAVTSMPNAVAGIYLARRGRGAAALSTGLNSNAINVAAGFLIPTAILGGSNAGAPGVLTAASYAALTGLILVVAFVEKGLTRRSGWVIVSLYAAFVVALCAVS